MSPDAFRRFALLVGCSAYAGGICALGVYVSLWIAAAALAGGGLLALIVTFEQSVDEPSANGEQPRSRSERNRQRHGTRQP